MINTILTIIAIVCLLAWTWFSVRQDRKFNEMYNYIKAMGEQNDEKALEYAQYVVEALKNKQSVLNYSAWDLQ